jgi:hypothetical protein
METLILFKVFRDRLILKKKRKPGKHQSSKKMLSLFTISNELTSWSSFWGEKYYIVRKTPICEEDLLPSGFIRKNSGESAWAKQYLSLPKKDRDEAARMLYAALTSRQRKELKETAHVTFECAQGHDIRVTPQYAGTSSVGCISLGSQDKSVHAPTTIGGFLLTLKIQFSIQCRCRSFSRY